MIELPSFCTYCQERSYGGKPIKHDKDCEYNNRKKKTQMRDLTVKLQDTLQFDFFVQICENLGVNNTIFGLGNHYVYPLFVSIIENNLGVGKAFPFAYSFSEFEKEFAKESGFEGGVVKPVVKGENDSFDNKEGICKRGDFTQVNYGELREVEEENEKMKAFIDGIEKNLRVYVGNRSLNSGFAQMLLDTFFTPKPTQLAKELLSQQDEETKKAMLELLKNTLNQEK